MQHQHQHTLQHTHQHLQHENQFTLHLQHQHQHTLQHTHQLVLSILMHSSTTAPATPCTTIVSSTSSIGIYNTMSTEAWNRDKTG